MAPDGRHRAIPGPLPLEWASAAEAPQFVEHVTRFTKNVTALGPPSEGLAQPDLQLKLTAARDAARGRKLRLSFGNLAKKLREAAVMSESEIESRVLAELNDLARAEVAQAEIMLRLALGPAITAELAAKVGLDPAACEERLAALAKRGRLVREGDVWRMPEEEKKEVASAAK